MAVGLKCNGVWTPHSEREGRPNVAALGLPSARFGAWHQDGTDLLILAPNDDAMPQLVKDLVAFHQTAGPVLACCALHLSGSLTRLVLEPLRTCGFDLAALHPLRAFERHETDGHGVKDTICGLEKGSDWAQEIETAFERAGATLVLVPARGKTLYHVAATMASNLVLGVMARADAILKLAAPDMNDSRQVIAALANQAASQFSAIGASCALTGPIERGDSQTLRRHLDALSPWPDDQEFYRVLSLIVLEIAKTKKNGDFPQAEVLRSLLDQPRR